MKNSNRRILLTLVLAAALAASACSSGESSAIGTAPADASTNAPRSTAEPTDAEKEEDELHEVLAAIVADTGVPALGAAVFDHEGLIDQATAGRRERDGSSAVTVDDTFHLGSNTKAMTAALLARLDEQGGLIGLDTTLSDAFGGGAPVHDDYSTVNLAQLLSHSGGTPADDDLDVDDEIFELPVTEARALGAQLILSEPPAVAPGTASVYSNAGYVVVAAAIEAATGQSWEDLMTAEVFSPLSMDSCGFGPPGIDGVDDQPLGHAADGQPIYFDNPAVLAPAGGIHCSMVDWGRFLVELLNGVDGNSTYLNQASIDRLFEPAATPVEGFDGGAALGWLVAEGPESTAWFHNGSNTAWFSQAAIVPAMDRAVLAVSNEAATGEQATALAFAALAELHPS